jgi:hypothetical protein
LLALLCSSSGWQLFWRESAMLQRLAAAVKGKLIWGLAASLLLFGALPSQASTLVDDGIYTVDANTGLQWLDVTTTLTLSYNDVLARLANTADPLYSYRFATGAEINQFIQDAGITSPLPCTNTCSPAPDLARVLLLLGVPIANTTDGGIELTLNGITADTVSGYPNIQWVAYLHYYGSDSYTQASFSPAGPAIDDSYSCSIYPGSCGSLLVRPVSTTPLPAGLPLFATGLGGLDLLLCWRRSKRKSAALAALPDQNT